MTVMTPIGRSDSIISASKSLWQKYRTHGLRLIPMRFVIIACAAIANGLQYTMRTNMSVTIVAMVNKSAITSTSSIPSELFNGTGVNASLVSFVGCPVADLPHNTTIPPKKDGEFEWNSSMQGLVLGAFYYGYIVTNIFGGQLAEYFGPRWLVAVSILISSVLSLLTPAAAFSITAIVIVRVITGMAQGVMSPAMYTMFAKWIPTNERSTALAILNVGGYVGTVLTMPMSGYLCEHGYAGGWPSVFYTLGITGCLCFVWWIYCVYDTPALHPRIRGAELIFIQTHVDSTTDGSKHSARVPWGPMLRSHRTWAVAITKFCSAWGNLMLMSKLPDYLESILHFPIEKNGMINAVVFIALSLSCMIFGYLSDMVARKELLSKEVSRKLFEAVSLLGPAICLALVPSVGCSQIAVIALIISSMALWAAFSGGDSPIVPDMAPDYSGSLYGVTNAVGSIPGFLAPLAVGVLLDQENGSIKMWNYAFYMTTGIYIAGTVVFTFFATSEPQPWGIKAGIVSNPKYTVGQTKAVEEKSPDDLTIKYTGFSTIVLDADTVNTQPDAKDNACDNHAFAA